MDSNSNPHICQCLGHILTVRRHATVTISNSGARQKSGEQFVNSVVALAKDLVELGISNGDIVAIVALNSEWYMEWFLAITFVGGIVAPLNPRWSLDEAREAVGVVKPLVLAVEECFRQWVVGLQIPSIRFNVVIGRDSFILDRSTSNDVRSIKRTLQEPMRPFNYQWAPNNVALICFTSGTTGRPKGVAISHMALVVQAQAKISIVKYGTNDVYLHTAPLCHIGGLSSCIAVLLAGGCHVFIPRFNAKEAVQAIEQTYVTALITVPAILSDLITVLRNQNRNCGDSVKKLLNGGGGLSTELITGATSVFPHATLISAYGMTEAGSSLTFITLYDPLSTKCGDISKNSSDGIMYHSDTVTHLGGSCVGKPPSHIELQIRSSTHDGPPFAGRILTRGAHVMVGYWDSSTAMMSALGTHDWLDTGDIGWMDVSGNLWLLGRTTNMIKSGGENVYPNEVEAILSQHPGVSSAVVFGIPNHRLTEIVVACVYLRESWEWICGKNMHTAHLRELSSEALQKHCMQRNLTRFKMPKFYIPWNKPFPYTTTGKLKREDVRKETMSSYLNFIPSNL